MVKVKICGIHDIFEAKNAIKYGADYLGILVNIPKTNLSLSPLQAKKIIKNQKKAKFIILTIEKDPKKLVYILKKTSPWGIQLLRPSIRNIKYLKKRTDAKIIPVIHIINKNAIKESKKYKDADFLLLDSKVGNNLGGTGKVHDWNISKKIIKQSPVPIFLAGGLNSKNVKESIRSLNPYCVDAESLLRNKKGFRDLKKVKEFIKKVKS